MSMFTQAISRLDRQPLLLEFNFIIGAQKSYWGMHRQLRVCNVYSVIHVQLSVCVHVCVGVSRHLSMSVAVVALTLHYEQ